MAEMRAIDFVQRLLDTGRFEQPRHRLVHPPHRDEERLRGFKLSTKFNGDWNLRMLRQYGREAADAWLRALTSWGGRVRSISGRGSCDAR